MLATFTILPLILLIAGLPIFLVLLGTSTLVIVLHLQIPPTVIAQTALNSLNNFNLLAVPFFLFAGALMSDSGMAVRLIRITTALLGSVRGSLPITNVGAATLYGSVTGATAATVAALGPTFYPEMLRRGYSTSFAAGLTTSAGFLGSIIPPSIMMIVYASTAEQSAIRLFTAGIVPGLLMAGLMMLYCAFATGSQGSRDRVKFSGSELFLALQHGKWAIGMPVVIFGGLYSGLFSPTESAGIACIYAIIVSVLVEKDFTVKDVWNVAVKSMVLTTQVFIIVVAAGVYSWLLTTNGIAQSMASFITGLGASTIVILLVINVMLLVIGCFLDPLSAILILTPLLIPIVSQIGVDPIHFGIIMIVNLSIGTFTPPFGVNIFVTQSILKVPLRDIYVGILPFFAVTIIGLLAITLLPSLSLTLVEWLN